MSKPDTVELEEFKNQVRIWMELNSSIKQLQQLARERRLFKKQLTDKILEFMHKYNIDDLTTKEGRLLCKSSYVKTPLPLAIIRKRVECVLTEEVPEKALTIASSVFNRDRAQRTSLSLKRITP
jgi:hypothetical protein